ncbi:hypothetical protein AB3K92_10675 [Burkholderia sp. Bmkn7]
MKSVFTRPLAGRLAIVVAAASLAACGATNPLQQAGQGIMGAR